LILDAPSLRRERASNLLALFHRATRRRMLRRWLSQSSIQRMQAKLV